MAKDHRVKLDVWKRALREAKLDGNFVEMNKIYNNMGKYYDLLGEYEVALECHNEELKLSVQFGSNEDVAVACRRVGDMNKTLQNFPDAINAYFQQLETAEKHNLDREEQRAYAGLGDVYRVRGDKFTEKDSAEDAKESWEVSERYLRKSIECAQKLARSDPERLEMIQNATLNLGLVKSSRGEPRPAIELMADAMEIATKRQDSVAKYLVSYNMVIEYINLEDYEKALEYAEKGLKLSKLTGDEANEAISCFQLGEINAKLRRYCVSAEHYRRYEEICDPEQKEEARELCTVAAKRVAAESRVRKMLKKLENGEEVDSPKIRGQIARLYMELSDYESAADHIQIRLGLIQETEDGGWDAYTETLDELVNALLEAGKSQAALPYAVEWVERMKRCESLDGAADAFYGYGLVHEELKEVEQALDAFKSSYELSVRASDLHLQRRALSKLVELQMSVAGAGAASKYQELLDGLPVAVESSSTSNGEDGEVISIAESINEADAELSPPVVRKRRKAGSSVSPSEAQDGALFRSAHSDEDLRSRTRNQSPPAGSDLSDNEEVNLHRQINVSKQLSLDNVDPELDSVRPTGSKDWVTPSPTPTRRLWIPQTSRSTSSSHSASGRSSSTTRKSPTVAHPRGPIADWIVDEEDPQTIARKHLVARVLKDGYGEDGVLNAFGRGLDDEGVTELVESARNYGGLSVLDLSANRAVTARGLEALFHGGNVFVYLKRLDVTATNIGADGFSAISDAISASANLPHLRELLVGYNSLGNRPSQTAAALSRLLGGRRKYLSVNLQKNFLSPEFLSALVQFVSSMEASSKYPLVRHLSFLGNSDRHPLPLLGSREAVDSLLALVERLEGLEFVDARLCGLDSDMVPILEDRYRSIIRLV